MVLEVLYVSLLSTFPPQAVASATLNVEVTLVSYSNPTSQDCRDCHCEASCQASTGSGTCDNVFSFCLRNVGSPSCFTTIVTEEIHNDSFLFSTPEIINILGIANPLTYSGIRTSVRYMFQKIQQFLIVKKIAHIVRDKFLIFHAFIPPTHTHTHTHTHSYHIHP